MPLDRVEFLSICHKTVAANNDIANMIMDLVNTNPEPLIEAPREALIEISRTMGRTSMLTRLLLEENESIHDKLEELLKKHDLA